MTTSILCNLCIALLLVTLVETRVVSLSHRSNRSPPRIRRSNDEKGDSDGSQELPRSSMHFSIVEGDKPRSGLSSNSALMIMAGVTVVLLALCYCCVNADPRPGEGHAQPCYACTAAESDTAGRRYGRRRQPLEIRIPASYFALTLNTNFGGFYA